MSPNSTILPLLFDFKIRDLFQRIKNSSPRTHPFLISGLDPDIQTLFSSRDSKAKLLTFNKARGADPEITEEDYEDFS